MSPGFENALKSVNPMEVQWSHVQDPAKWEEDPDTGSLTFETEQDGIDFQQKCLTR